MRNFRKSFKKSSKGQVLVIVAITLTALVAIIGLAIDMGYMYVSYARLRRAVDAAALAASGEFKRNYKADRLQGAAQQMLDLNLDGKATEGNPDFPVISVETCDTVATLHGLLPIIDHIDELVNLEQNTHPGQEVCFNPLRKMVRVTVTENVHTYFLQVLPGFSTYPIQVVSLSEAAAVDVMLVIDTSESMTYGWPAAPTSGDARNPVACNADDPTGVDGMPGSCFPFQDVKKAADLFLNNLYFPYDRVGIVTFDKNAVLRLELNDNYDTINTAIRGLQVYEGNNNCPFTRADRPGDPSLYPALSDSDGYGTINPCRLFSGGSPNTYIGFDCGLFYGPTPLEDASQCTTTNMADGVALSGAILTGDYSSAASYFPVPSGGWPVKRDQALWVLLLLTDGGANAGHDQNGGAICPRDYNSYTWTGALCRDDDALVRHCWQASDLDCMGATYPKGNPPYPHNTISIVDQAHYDPDDRTRDMFDIVSRNSTLIFTIGMGDAQKTDRGWDSNNPPVAPGETLLKYGAFGTTNDMTNSNALLGLYNYGNNPSDLTRIFLAIANNLATRINQ